MDAMERGMRGSRGGGCSKVAVSDAIALDRAAAFGESAAPDFGYGFLTRGGGVDRFLAFAFSNVEARALKAGDLPLTRTRSGLNDTLLERCGFSVATDLPPCDDTALFLINLLTYPNKDAGMTIKDKNIFSHQIILAEVVYLSDLYQLYN
ncbi:hypothetical protein Lser_V15G38172 [Lactuca serriola]